MVRSKIRVLNEQPRVIAATDDQSRCQPHARHGASFGLLSRRGQRGDPIKPHVYPVSATAPLNDTTQDTVSKSTAAPLRVKIEEAAAIAKMTKTARRESSITTTRTDTKSISETRANFAGCPRN